MLMFEIGLVVAGVLFVSVIAGQAREINKRGRALQEQRGVEKNLRETIFVAREQRDAAHTVSECFQKTAQQRLDELNAARSAYETLDAEHRELAEKCADMDAENVDLAQKYEMLLMQTVKISENLADVSARLRSEQTPAPRVEHVGQNEESMLARDLRNLMSYDGSERGQEDLRDEE